jgi:hypothetical protein
MILAMFRFLGYRWPLVIVALAVLVIGAAGCQSGKATMPVTHVVKGMVRFKDGKPLKGGSIQFEPVANRSLTIRGEIKKDGTFSLYTLLVDGRKADGAIEGTHKVLVIPPMSADQTIEPIKVLTTECTIKPGENVVTIEIERDKPASRRPGADQ